ncbi:DUF86 domain-containing protein [Candidatus Pacearchaeota archaeon]|nr:DUF86 domain-containing protein [Candidatus Pacearchaeota archaeon]
MLSSKIYLDEILRMIEKIEGSVLHKSFDDFLHDDNLLDATLMRLHFIGENIKNISFTLKKKYPHVKWRKLAKLRNIISHKYSMVNKEIIWDVITNTLPDLKKEIAHILNEEKF